MAYDEGVYGTGAAVGDVDDADSADEGEEEDAAVEPREGARAASSSNSAAASSLSVLDVEPMSDHEVTPQMQRFYHNVGEMMSSGELGLLR